MKIKVPFTCIDENKLLPIFLFMVLFTILVMVALQIFGGPLVTGKAPLGIVSYEFAGDLSTARRMIESWDPVVKIYAGLNLGLDFLFLVSYSFAISLGCFLVSRAFVTRSGFVYNFGAVIAWAQFAAAILDAIENYALIKVLLGASNTVLPALAKWCAIPKFVIVGVGLVYILAGALWILVSRLVKR